MAERNKDSDKTYTKRTFLSVSNESTQTLDIIVFGSKHNKNGNTYNCIYHGIL